MISQPTHAAHAPNATAGFFPQGMGRLMLLRLVLGTIVLGLPGGMRLPAAAATNDPWTIDFRYAPPWWQTSICLPDDWQKTLVGKEGSLLYDYPGNYSGFGTRITFGLQGETRWLKQELAAPRVPIVRTTLRNGDVEVVQETFAVAPPLVRLHETGGASR